MNKKVIEYLNESLLKGFKHESKYIELFVNPTQDEVDEIFKTNKEKSVRGCFR